MNNPNDDAWRILLIEDDEDDYVLTQSMLKQTHGRTVALEWASSYEVGKQKLQDIHYDAVLVDYDLGVRTGIELIREMVTQGFPAPLILLTGRGSYEVDLEAIQAGATLYITKTEVNPLLLERSIRYAIERKQADVALRQSETEFRAIFELTNTGKTVYDPVVHRYLRANRKFCEIIGYTEAELQNASFVDLTHPEDRQADLAIYQRALQGEHRGWENEKRYVRKDGSVVWVAVSGSVVCDSEGRPIRTYAVVQDITERKGAEEALRESEARLNRSQEIAHLGSWEFDLITNRLTWSDEVYRIFGLQPQEFAATYEAFLEAVHPDDRAAVDNAYSSSIREGRDTYEIEHRVVRKTTGEVRTVHEKCTHLRDSAGQIVRSIGMVHDITERKQTEETLRDREEMLRLALTAGRAGVWSWDLASDAVRWSEEYYRIFGFEPGSLPPSAEAGFNRVHPEDRSRVEAELREAMAQGTPIDEVHRVVWPDGSIHWVRGMARAFSGEQGKPYRLAGIAIDITGQKRAEIELQAAHRRTAEVLESIADGFFALDKNWRFTYINKRAVQIAGVEAHQIIGQTLWELWPGLLSTPVEAHYRQAMETGLPVQFQAAGQESGRWYAISVYPSGDGISVFFQDRTDQVRAEQALRRSEEAYRTLFESVDEGFCVIEVLFDEHEKPVDYRFLETNPAFERQTGIANAVGRRMREIAPLHEEHWFEIYGKIALTGDALRFENPAEQLHRYYDVYAFRVGEPAERKVAILFNDITARIRMEEALQKAHEMAMWMARFPEENPNPVARVSAAGSVLYRNTAAARLPGWNLEVDQVLPASLLPLVEQALARGEEVVQDVMLAGQYYSVSAMPFPEERYVNLYGREITERKRMEEALRESEGRFRAMADGTPMIIWVTNPAGGIEFVNRAYCDFFGVTLEQVQSEGWQPLVHPDNTAGYVDEFAACNRDRRPFRAQARVRRADGEWRWIDSHGQPRYSEAGEFLGMAGSSLDVTEQILAEEALRKSEAHFRDLAEAMPHLVWTARPDGAVDYYNQRYHEYDGITLGPDDRWEWRPALHPDDRQPTVDAWQRAVETGESYQMEHRFHLADGSYRWHLTRAVPVKDADGQIVRWYGTNTDIHARKLAEQTLQRHTEALERSNQDLQEFALIASHDLQEPLRKIKQFGDHLTHRVEKDRDDVTRDYLSRMVGAADRMQIMIQDLLELSRVSTHGQAFTEVDLAQVAEEVISDLEIQILKDAGQVEVEPLARIEADPVQMHQLLQNLVGNALKYHKPGVPPRVFVTAEIRAEKTGKPPLMILRVEDNGIGFGKEEADRIFQPFQRLHGRSSGYDGTGMGLSICKKIVERHGGSITAESVPGQGSTFMVTLPVRHAE